MESPLNPNQDNLSAGATLDSNAPVLDLAKAEKHRRLFQRGIKLLCAGSVLMISSFGVNYLLYHSGVSFEYVMYGMTTLGIACMMKGVADVLGF